MSERANYFKLGLFVIVATGLLLVVVALLGARSVFQRTVTFETCFKESVQGIEIGSAVKLRGVKLGKVQDIMFALDKYGDQAGDAMAQKRMENFVIVEMAIDLGDPSVDFLVRELDREVADGLRTRLTMAGITGGSFLELVYLNAAENPPMEIPWKPSDPYIPSAQSVLGQITSAAERIARQLEDANIGAILADIGQLVKNLDGKVQQIDVVALQGDAIKLIDGLRDTNQRVQQVLGNPAIDSTLDNVAATAAAVRKLVDGGEQDLAAFVHDLPEVSAKARSTLADLERLLNDDQTKRMLANLAQATDSAPAAMDDLRQLLRRLDVLVSSQQANLESIIISLRRTMDNLDALSADAKQNPSRLLFGDPPPRIDPGAGAPPPRR